MIDDLFDEGRREPERRVTLAIFGATGDLARRKLFPALYNLFVDGRLPDALDVVAFARRPFDDASFRRFAGDECARFVSERPGERPFSAEAWRHFESRVSYFRGDFGDEETYRRLAADKLSDRGRDFLFYLACAPDSFAEVAAGLANAGFGTAGVPFDPHEPWRRLVVEKPFGYDLRTARALNRALMAAFDEDDIYRVDHYLGKEAIQNLLFFRFTNSIFEPAWNRRFVERVDVRVLETMGILGRGGYYDRAGAARDMIQNHLLQVLCLAAMEPPASLAARDIREQKVRVLRSIPAYDADACRSRSLRARYAAGTGADGARIPAYLDEDRVAPDSATETFAALELGVDNWRWSGVPFRLVTGKALRERRSEIVVRFRQPAEPPYANLLGAPGSATELVVNIRPEAGIAIGFNAKDAASSSVVREAFAFAVKQRGDRIPEAYERLLSDAIAGDPTLFTRFDEVEEAWRITDAFIESWKDPGFPLGEYAAGSDGPNLSRYEKTK